MTISAHEATIIIKESVRETIRKRSWLFLVQGMLLAVAGAVAIIFPLFMGEGLVVLLGWILIISGLVQLISLLSAKEAPSFFLQLISIVLNVVVGVLLLANVGAGLIIVTLLLLVTFMVGGMARVVFALMIRPLPNWGWILAGGIVAILCSFILFANLPAAAAWLLGTLLGLNLLAFGLSEMYLAWKIRGTAATTTAGAGPAASAAYGATKPKPVHPVSEPGPGVTAVESDPSMPPEAANKE